MTDRLRHALAAYADRRIATMLMLGFASGLPLPLVFGTLQMWLKEAGLTNTTIGIFGLVALPYSAKFLWAPAVDRLALPGVTRLLGQRRGWIASAQVGLVGAIAALSVLDPARTPELTAAAALALCFLSATQDVAIDAWRVESFDADEQGAASGAAIFGYRMGMLLSGAGALLIATGTGSWGMTFRILAGVMALGFVGTWMAREPVRPKAAHDVRGWTVAQHVRDAIIGPLSDFARRKDWVAIGAFVLLFKLGDALAGAMTTPFLVDTGFTKLEIATVSKSWGLVASIGGALLGGALVRAVGVQHGLWIGGVAQMLSNLLFAAQAAVGHDTGFLTLTIGLENLTGGLGSAGFVAYLSSLCNVRYTATQYALLTSLSSVGRTFISSGSGWLASQIGWIPFFVATTAAAFPGLALLFWLLGRERRREREFIEAPAAGARAERSDGDARERDDGP